MTDQFRSLLLQLESEHNRQLTEQAMAHAAEIAKLKDRIKELERKDALDKLAAIAQDVALSPEPDWSTAPEWARWWAVDADGLECWYENKPSESLVGRWWDKSRTNGLDRQLEKPTVWQNTARQRPQPDTVLKGANKC